MVVDGHQELIWAQGKADTDKSHQEIILKIKQK